MPTTFEIGKIYTVNTLAPALLGVSLKNAKLKSIADFDTAFKLTNIRQIHASLLPVLPNGTPQDPSLGIYYVFNSESNETVVMSQYWLDMNSIILVEDISIVVEISEISVDDIPHIRNAITSLGIHNINIRQI